LLIFALATQSRGERGVVEMPNIHVHDVGAKWNQQMLFCILQDKLPPELLEDMVITKHLLRKAPIPYATIAASSGTSESELQLIVEAVRMTGMIVPDDWRYWPEFPKTERIDVNFWGVDREKDGEAVRLFNKTIPNHIEHRCSYFWSTVEDFSGTSTPCAEIVSADFFSASIIAFCLKDVIDVEHYYYLDREPIMNFWAKGTKPSLDDMIRKCKKST
jgi:hypothetical protein